MLTHETKPPNLGEVEVGVVRHVHLKQNRKHISNAQQKPFQNGSIENCTQ
jgi:hypothetical protein